MRDPVSCVRTPFTQNSMVPSVADDGFLVRVMLGAVKGIAILRRFVDDASAKLPCERGVEGDTVQPMRISCVIVSYNNGGFLRDAIMMVVEQTHPIDEIIIADDASTDQSQDLISSLARIHPADVSQSSGLTTLA